jgi:putative hydrolase of the HAD superfamily
MTAQHPPVRRFFSFQEIFHELVAQFTRVLLLDAVGTTIHPAQKVSQTYLEFGEKQGSTLQEEEIGRRFRQAFQTEEEADRRTGFVTSEKREEERWRGIVRAVFHDVPETQNLFGELWEYYRQPKSWRVFAGIPEFLGNLSRRGVRVILASNFDSRLRMIVGGLPELAGIEHLAISSEIGWKKPGKEFFAAVMRRWELSAGEVLVVGDDAINDYEGALAAGLRARLVNPLNAGV